MLPPDGIDLPVAERLARFGHALKLLGDGHALSPLSSFAPLQSRWAAKSIARGVPARPPALAARLPLARSAIAPQLGAHKTQQAGEAADA